MLVGRSLGVRRQPRRCARWIDFAALVTALSVSLGAAAKLASSGSSSAGFRASGPDCINIDGKSTDVRVTDDGSTVTITVGLGALDTGMGLRDKHTKERSRSTSSPRPSSRSLEASSSSRPQAPSRRGTPRAS